MKGINIVGNMADDYDISRR